MTSLIQLFVAPLQETFFQKALIGGSMVAIVSGVVGCLVVLRRMSFLGDALSHAMIAGVRAIEDARVGDTVVDAHVTGQPVSLVNGHV